MSHRRKDSLCALDLRLHQRGRSPSASWWRAAAAAGLAGGAHDERAVLLEHAQDRARARAAVQPAARAPSGSPFPPLSPSLLQLRPARVGGGRACTHQNRPIRGKVARAPEHDGCVLRLGPLGGGEPVVQLRAGPGVQEAGVMRRRPASRQSQTRWTVYKMSITTSITRLTDKAIVRAERRAARDARRPVVGEGGDTVGGRRRERASHAEAEACEQHLGGHEEGSRGIAAHTYDTIRMVNVYTAVFGVFEKRSF